MCRRCAASERDSPWRSRSAASVCPRVRDAALSALSSTDSTATLLAPLEQLLRLRGVGEPSPQLLQEALLGPGILVRARELHAEDERLEVRRGREAHVAQQIGLGILVRGTLESDHREVVERADEIGTDQHRAAQGLLGALVVAGAAHA